MLQTDCGRDENTVLTSFLMKNKEMTMREPREISKSAKQNDSIEKIRNLSKKKKRVKG